MAAKYAKILGKYYTVGEGSQLQQITESDIQGRMGDISPATYDRFGVKQGDWRALLQNEAFSGGGIQDIDPSQVTFGKEGELLVGGQRLSLAGSGASVKPGTTLEQFGALPTNPDFANYLKETGQTYDPTKGFSGLGTQPGGLPSSQALGYFKLGTDVYENTGGGQSRKLSEQDFQNLGINYNLLGEGLPMTKTLEQVRDTETKQLVAAGGKLGEPSAAITAGFKPPAPSPTGGTPEQPQNNQAVITGINDEANADQDAALNAILDEFGKVDTSQSKDLSDKLLSTVEDLLTTPAPKKPTSMADLFASKKAELGVDKLETDLAGIDAQIKQLDADFASQTETEEGKLISTREISRNLGQAEIAYNRKRRDLLVEKSIISDQYNTKLKSLEMVMDFTQQDFTNSSNYYNQQFNKNMSMLNLVLNLEEKAQSRQDKAKNEAQANLNTVTNLMTTQNIKWDSLSDSQKSTISKLELSAGLPQGITSLVSKSAPNLEIKATTSRTDASGNAYYDVLMVDPKTNALTVKSVFKGKEKPEDKTPTTADVDSARSLIIQGLEKTKGDVDGLFDPDKYASARNTFKKAYPKADVKDLDKQVADRFSREAIDLLRTKYGIIIPE